MPRLLLITLLAFTSVTSATPLSILRRDPPLNDSITYCSSVDRGNNQEYYIPCTRTSDPLSEVLTWLPYQGPGTTGRFAAHYECYVETCLGDRYFAGHPASGSDPCWVTASLLGPTSTYNASVVGSRLGCKKDQLASCCAFRAAGLDFNGYINSTYALCP